MNILDQRPENLAQTHHAPILKAVLAALETYNPFAWHSTGRRLLLDVDSIAQKVLAKPWRDTDVLTPAPQGRASTSTLHMPPDERDEVRRLLHRIQSKLIQHLEERAGSQSHAAQDLARQSMDTLDQLLPFGTLAPQMQTELRRAFQARRKRLTFSKPGGQQPSSGNAPLHAAASSPVMRWHKLTLTIQVPEQIIEQLAEAVRIKLVQLLAPSDHEELHQRINEQKASPHSELARLIDLIASETVGQIKKEACLSYLAFLEEQIDERNKARPALRELLHRLRLLQAYLRREDKADTDYEVTYQSQTMNLRSLFAQATAFSDLPVYPLVDGSLGEIADNGATSYVFGMKLKLNGRVAPYNSPSSFDYHLGLLQKHYPAQPGRLVRLAILYHLVFSNYGDSTYDPITALERDVLPLLQADTTSADGQAAVDRLFASIATSCQQARGAVNVLAVALRNVVKQTTQAPPQRWDVQLTLREGILENNPSAILDEGRLLRQGVFAPDRKDYLAYLEVGEAQVSSHAILALRAQIAFEDIHCFEAESLVETCGIGYDTNGWSALPIIFWVPPKPLTPLDLTTDLDSISPPNTGLMLRCAAQITYNGALLPAQTISSTAWFLYRYVVTLLAYLGIRLLASFSPDPKRLFISLARMHRVSEQEGGDGDPESFLSDLSKVLAQMLSVDYLTNAQGLVQPPTPAGSSAQRQADATLRYRQQNAATSLYALLPKVFTLEQSLPPDVLPRLALVVVSSRESDGLSQRSPDAPERLVTVYGEVVGIDRLDAHKVRVERRATFSDTYPAAELYTNPEVILDQIHHLYQADYRHIFYIAQAPYSSTLHITRAAQNAAAPGQEEDGLFFLSRQIITRCLREKQGLSIYPVFRDQYHAMKLRRDLGADTLYIQDVADLVRVVDDRSQARQMVVFLNLFSGHENTASRDGVDKYNGVVSYATLLNIYGGVLNERELRAALIHDEAGKNHLKNLLILSLTLFHLSRYEKQEKAIAIKLNPYESIIGDESVGAAAWQPHANRAQRFNMLSFLTMVRKDILATPEKRGEQ